MRIPNLVEGVRLTVGDIRDAASIYGARSRARNELRDGLEDFVYLLGNDACGGIHYGDLISKTVLPLIDPEGVYPISSKDGQMTRPTEIEKIFGKKGGAEIKKKAAEALTGYMWLNCDRDVRRIGRNAPDSYSNIPDEDTFKSYVDACVRGGILHGNFYENYQSRLEAAKRQQKWLIEADKQAEWRWLEDGFKDVSGRVQRFPTYRKVSGGGSESGRLSRADIYCFNLQAAYDHFVEVLENSANYLSEHLEHRDMLGLAAGETFRVIEEKTLPLLEDTENRTGDLFIEGVGNIYDRMWKLFDLPFSKEGVILGELYELAEKGLGSQERKLEAESAKLEAESAKLSERRRNLRESRAALGI